jgi:DNA-binding response OmpR family regulator
VEGGEVLLEPRKSVTAVLMLTDDTIQTLRIQVLDAGTDAVLYESPKDVPVRVMT